MNSKSTDKIPAPAKILTGAADVIDERGWFQGASQDPFGRGVCAIGAVHIAVGLEPLPDISVKNFAAFDRVADVVEELTRFLDIETVTDWNDAIGRTADEVTTALRECAAKLAGTAK